MQKICTSDDYPSHSAVIQWVMDDKDGCSNQYARARERQAELLADEIIAIADDSSGDTIVTEDGKVFKNREFAERSRLRFDARKWYLSKVLPKVYGDKIDLNHGGKVELTGSGISNLLASLTNDSAPAEDPADGGATGA